MHNSNECVIRISNLPNSFKDKLDIKLRILDPKRFRATQIIFFRSFKTGFKRHSALICFKTPEEAAEAIKELRFYRFDHNEISVDYYEKDTDQIPRKLIFLRGIPRHIGRRELWERLEDLIGSIRTIFYHTSPESRPLGTATLRLTNAADVEKAMDIINHRSPWRSLNAQPFRSHSSLERTKSKAIRKARPTPTADPRMPAQAVPEVPAIPTPVLMTGVPHSWSPAEVRSLFKAEGLSLQWPKPPVLKSRMAFKRQQWAVLTLPSKADAWQVMERLDGHCVGEDMLAVGPLPSPEPDEKE